MKPLLQELTEIKQRVANIDERAAVIAELDRMGQPSAEALALLKTMQQIRVLLIHYRERILGELTK